MDHAILHQFHDIPSRSNWVTIEQVTKGWSKDKKYYVENQNGDRFLLRISDPETYEAKKKEFDLMKEVYQLGITMSAPLDFGVCDNGKCVYSLLSWIDGTAADEVIQTLSEEDQYRLGVEAAKVLRKMHSIPAPPAQQDWEERMLKRIHSRLDRYQRSGIKVDNDQFALQFIQEHLHLVKNRPQTYQHGDFHVGNLIITPNQTLGVIDFNRWDYGDPFEEFYKMMLFSREISIPFATGQIDGYFQNQVPAEFFDLLAFYLADVILFSVVWAIPFGSKEVGGMIQRAKMILSDYNNFSTTIPVWYARRSMERTGK